MSKSWQLGIVLRQTVLRHLVLRQSVLRQLATLLASALLTMSFGVNADTNSEIAERIQKVGSVCLEGSECGEAASSTVAASGSEASGGVEDNYNKSCATCHNAGIAGAPKLGDAAQWASRIAKGKDVLYSSSIDGLPPAMPAKGMCFSCSDDDLRALVDFMIEATE